MSATARLSAALAGRYRIERELGRGGMATVYLAKDLKHERDVAIKVLQTELAASVSGDRFLQEIRVTAKLTHPQILPLLDSGYVDGDAEQPVGQPYYVMPFVAGETLRQRMARDGRIPLDETVRIVREVADALDYANGRGVVHRDIKPENLLLLENHAIVADFGIARAIDAGAGRVTMTGMIVGTPAYMSPEQATGDQSIDGRSDQYALACVVYEMLTGRPPFPDKTPLAVLAAHAHNEPPSPRETGAEISREAESAIRRAMSKLPADRFPTALAFADAVAAGHAPVRRRRSATGLIAAAVVVGVLGLAYAASRGRKSSLAENATRVAVLPFRSISPDPADGYFAEGMTDEMISALSRIGGLKVIARSSMTPSIVNGKTPIEIAHALGVGTILEGSVRKEGSRIRISVSLSDPESGESRWSENYDKTVTDVFGIQQDVATAIARELKVTLSADTRSTKGTTDRLAYEAYLRATALVSSSNGARPTPIRDSTIALLRQALSRDSSFALAWAGLSSAYTEKIFNEGAPQAVRDSAVVAVARALALDTALAEAYRARSNLAYTRESGWDNRNALRDALRAVALKPGWAEARATLASLFFHIGFFSEAQHEMESALSLDPKNYFVIYRIPRVLWLQQRFQEALDTYQRDRAHAVKTSAYEEALVLGYLGRASDGIALLDHPDSSVGQPADFASARAVLLARMGRNDEARRFIREAEQLGASTSHFHHAAFAIATAYALMGDDRNALEWLERTARDGMPALALFERDPTLTKVRLLPEYKRLAASLQKDEADFRRIMKEASYSIR